jgi:hypothetical protein
VLRIRHVVGPRDAPEPKSRSVVLPAECSNYTFTSAIRARWSSGLMFCASRLLKSSLRHRRIASYAKVSTDIVAEGPL